MRLALGLAPQPGLSPVSTGGKWTAIPVRRAVSTIHPFRPESRTTMGDLERFRDHCRQMTQPGAHRDTCHATFTDRWTGQPASRHPDPDCSGCVPDRDRELFARLADEADDYLTRNADEVIDFGAMP